MGANVCLSSAATLLQASVPSLPQSPPYCSSEKATSASTIARIRWYALAMEGRSAPSISMFWYDWTVGRKVGLASVGGLQDGHSVTPYAVFAALRAHAIAGPTSVGRF
ncbi:hypothetical protein PoMZ_10339 [Pyricularia oryzae]|uniref:Uncharacterized protein n=1 Tax=Pyricularia oryzae TaxID=318829 RepID=A0A4P7MXH6_PYROR|nr:hypothetical protein PoMZ_10339 [Pyricularia oryzae]